MSRQSVSLSLSAEHIKAMDLVANMTGKTRSAIADLSFKAAIPFYNKIIYHRTKITQIEEFLLNQSVDAHLSLARGKPEIAPEELFGAVWKNNIKSQHNVLGFEHYRHNTNDGTMGKGEKKIIEEQLESFVDTYRMKGAIHIKTDRIIDTNGPNVRGCSSTILIKEKSWNGYFFDFNHIVTLPISDLIIFGVKEVLKRENIYFDVPYICWINIYHTNDLAVMIPIIREEELSERYKNEKSIIVINPFAEGTKK